MSRSRILIVESASKTCRDLDRILKPHFRTQICTEVRETLALMRTGKFDLVVTGLVMSEISGFELLKWLRQSDVLQPIILVTSWGSERCSAEAKRLGATDFLGQPVDPDELIASVTRALKLPHPSLPESDSDLMQLGEMISRDPAMADLFSTISRIAASDSRVLILGKTGTGKRLCARAIHTLSSRSSADFVELNCAAVPDTLIESELFGHERGAYTGATATWHGRFQEAGHGTLFLDEIGEIGLGVQSKLLQVLQTGEFMRVGGKGLQKNHSRVITATNRNLSDEVENGQFRADLFYRLNVLSVSIPALSERPNDIELLANTFLKRYQHSDGEPRQFAPDAIQLLKQYHWPGNVRELENVVERVAILAPEPELGVESLISQVPQLSTRQENLPSSNPAQICSYQEARNKFEKQWLQTTLKRASHNMAEAARLAGMDRAQFYRMAKRHNLTKHRRET